MSEIAARQLRNEISGVLRRVEAGERLTVTVSGRPVAELRPLPRRRPTLPWQEYLQWRSQNQLADPGLLSDLREHLPDTTDSVTP